MTRSSSCLICRTALPDRPCQCHRTDTLTVLDSDVTLTVLESDAICVQHRRSWILQPQPSLNRMTLQLLSRKGREWTRLSPEIHEESWEEPACLASRSRRAWRATCPLACCPVLARLHAALCRPACLFARPPICLKPWLFACLNTCPPVRVPSPASSEKHKEGESNNLNSRKQAEHWQLCMARRRCRTACFVSIDTKGEPQVLVFLVGSDGCDGLAVMCGTCLKTIFKIIRCWLK